MAQTPIGNSRFEIGEQLGSGGFGIVYEAFDTDQQLAVALKTIRSTDSSAIRSFKREFRALTDFVHPNLVSLYELFTEGGECFFTMELVRGTDFLRHVRPGYEAAGANTFNLSLPSDELLSDASGSADGPFPGVDRSGVLDTDRLRSAIEQVVYGVSAMHGAGILHRDLKPSNILVDEDGRLVLLDFGLAAELAARRHGRQKLRIGTPAYMAPEVADGAVSTASSDWYSVGCLIFEALTGRVPFLGSPRQMVAAKRSRDAPRVHALAPDAPFELAALADALLRREPERRPPAAEIRRVLGIRAGAVAASAFVGREDELESLKHHVTGVLPGQPRVVLVTGASGMGKSMLVDQFLAEIHDDTDVLVFSGRCYERESVPYKALDELVEELAAHLRSLPAAERDRYQPEDDAALMRVFQCFDGMFESTSATDLDPAELRRRAGLALRGLLGSLAEDAFVALHIDDLQWGDTDSAAILTVLLQPPDAPAIFVLGTMRPEGEDTDVYAALQELGRMGVAVEELGVGGLDDEAARSMLAGRVEEPIIDTLLAEAQGTPFLLDALARHVSEYGGEAAVSVAAIVSRRMEQLPAVALRLLEFIAVAGQPVERTLLREATGLSGDQAAIGYLVRSHLVRSMGGPGQERVVAYHDSIRETVVGVLGEGAAEIHGQIADALDRLGLDVERRFVHRRAAGHRDRARALAVESAEKAVGLLAFGHGADLYAQAISLGEQSFAIYRAWAEALVNAGRPYAAGEAYLQAEQRAPESERIELRRAAAEQFLSGGHADRGVEVMSSVLASLGLSLASSPNTALAKLLWNRTRLWWRGLGYQIREQVRADELLEVDTLWSVASAMSVIDTIRATDFQVRHLLRALDVGEPYRVCRALALEGPYSVTENRNKLARSEEILNEAQSLADGLEDRRGRAIVQLQRGIRDFLIGDWPASSAALETAELLLRDCRGMTWELSQVITFSVDALSLQGDWARLRRIIPPRLSEARRNGNLQLIHYLEYARAVFIRVAEDEPDVGLEAMAHTFVHRAEHGFTTPDWWRMMGNSLLHAYKGDSLAAWDAWEADWPALCSSLLLRVDVMSVAGRYHRARLALGRARDTGDSAYVVLARREAAVLLRSTNGWGPALGQLIEGLCAYHGGDTPGAINRLEGAEEKLRDLDMRLHAASARYRRGQWAGDEEGVVTAESQIRSLGITRPDRFAAVYAPSPVKGVEFGG